MAAGRSPASRASAAAARACRAGASAAQTSLTPSIHHDPTCILRLPIAPG